MGYGVFRRAPRVGPPLRKKLAIGLFPARSLDTPPLRHNKPTLRQLTRDRKANYKRRKVLAPVFTAQPAIAPPDFIHVATRRIVPMVRRDVFRWKWSPKVILTCAPIPASIPVPVPAIPLHPHTVPWLRQRRKQPRKTKRILATLLIAGTTDSPPLRRPKPSWRLYRKPPFKKPKPKWNWQLFNVEPFGFVKIFRWFARPTQIVARSQASRSIAARLFATPIPPVIVADTHDGGLPKRRSTGKAPQYSDALLRKLAEERERKRKERERFRAELTALVEGRPIVAAGTPTVLPPPVKVTAPLPAVGRIELRRPASVTAVAPQREVVAKIETLRTEIAALDSEITRIDRRIREEEQVILFVLGLYDD